jgi:hypothetical protein
MNLDDLVPIAITFVVVGIVLSFGLSILGDTRDEFGGFANCGQNSSGGTTGKVYTACGADYNATRDSMEANTSVASKLPLLGLVIAAAIIIGVLLSAFRTK